MKHVQSSNSSRRSNKKIGDKFHHLTIIEQLPSLLLPSGSIRAIFLARCDCGETCEISSRDLAAGYKRSCHKRSCTCGKREFHGKARTTEHGIWGAMKQRCSNQKAKCYPHYGGRGITVCAEWKNSFSNFFEDMGPRPSKDHSLDRIDVNKGYNKENCRWATGIEQRSNKRRVGPLTEEVERLRNLCTYHGIDPDQKI